MSGERIAVERIGDARGRLHNSLRRSRFRLRLARRRVSLTMAAAVVIFSLLVLEKLTESLVPPQAKHGIRALVPFLLVTGASVLLLGAAAFRWRGFSVRGAVGVTAVVAAVVTEGFVKGKGE